MLELPRFLSSTKFSLPSVNFRDEVFGNKNRNIKNENTLNVAKEEYASHHNQPLDKLCIIRGANPAIIDIATPTIANAIP